MTRSLIRFGVLAAALQGCVLGQLLQLEPVLGDVSLEPTAPTSGAPIRCDFEARPKATGVQLERERFVDGVSAGHGEVFSGARRGER